MRTLVPAADLPDMRIAWPSIFRWLMLIGVANGLAPTAINALASEGVWTALGDTFGISAITLMAVIIGWMLASRMPRRPVDGLDALAIAVYALALMLPFATTSMAGVVALGLYAGLREPRSTETVAAASVFGAIGLVGMLLGVPLHLFSGALLALDARLAAMLLRLVHPDAVAVGNLIETQSGQPLIVEAGCASAPVVLQTLLCWLAMARFFRPAWQPGDLVIVPILVAAVVAVNTARIAAMGLNAASYSLVHGPLGIYAASSLCILLAAAGSRWTLRGSRATPSGAGWHHPVGVPYDRSEDGRT